MVSLFRVLDFGEGGSTEAAGALQGLLEAQNLL